MILRSDIPEERDQARAEAIADYRERVTWRRCGACGQFEPWDPRIGEFVWPCGNRPLSSAGEQRPHKPTSAGSTPAGATKTERREP